ncbi:hypothetical protein [Catenuloplanes indicus]|uniref:Uncharacterized protein n=1 Tax=Catenuloplanes indicus TaxID=137267 RepID=A0AAE4B2B4_9ACTN|nr:hypothetical protein [Catenuloplanes indicus]MDQ0371509.1 hypothetical protein [Catenuloplanes indicus]
MTYSETPDDPWTVTVNRANAIAFARGIAVIAAVGAAVFWLIPAPEDPGIAACARLEAHAVAGTVPDLAERAQIGKDLERSDEEVLQTAGLYDRLHRDGGSILSDAIPLPPMDLDDISPLQTACAAAGMP